MRLRIKIQRHLVVAYRAEDSGEWLFTLCRRGMEELVGQRLKPGTELTVEVSGKIVSDHQLDGQ